MKRSELPLLFPGIVLLLAAAAYALLFFTSRAEDVPSAVCTAALWQDTLSLKGVVSRGETPVSAPEGAVYPLVPDGERVAAGAPVALAGETGAELFRAALLLRVRAELASDTLPVPGGQALRSLSEALARRGAEVVLISGRTSLPTPTGVRRIDVLSAQEMYEASVREFATADGAVMCAAVADYTPEEVAPTKLKKGDGELTIRLKRTHDIAAELGAHKAGRILVGFALETDHEEANAEGKLQRKNFDFIVLNSLRDAGAGFGVDTNKVTLIDRAGREELPLLSKAETAEKIADKIESILK